MNRDKVPLNWVEIIAALAMIAMFTAFLCWEKFRTDSPFHAFLAVILIGVMLYALWGLTECKELDAEGIHCTRFGKELRSFRWDQIQQIGILRYTTRGKYGKITQRMLVIIPKSCEPFVHQIDDSTDYVQRNKSRILSDDPKHAPLFEKYYGALDFDV